MGGVGIQQEEIAHAQAFLDGKVILRRALGAHPDLSGSAASDVGGLCRFAVWRAGVIEEEEERQVKWPRMPWRATLPFLRGRKRRPTNMRRFEPT